MNHNDYKGLPPAPYQAQGQPQPPYQPSHSPYPTSGTEAHFAGQQETYAASVFGNQVPKGETANPKGVITCGDLSLTIDGALVPVVDVMLGQNLSIYFEHHILLWKSPNTNVRIQSSGAFRRMFAGMNIFQTAAFGPGNIAFSRDSVGQIVCLRLQPGQTVEVREHQFILATSNVSYTFTTFRGIGNILFSGSGLFIDTFTCQGPHDGLVLLHGYGNVFEKELQPGEAFDVEPGAWLWKDPSVQMQTINVMQSQGSGGSGGGKSSFLNKLGGAIGNLASGGGSIFMNRMVGPGRVGLQSMSYHPPQAQGTNQT